MSSVEEYNIAKLFQIPWYTTLLHPKVIEWDLFINRLKKSAKVPVEELKEMWSRKRSIRKSLDTIYDLTRSSNTAHNTTLWQPLHSLSQKLERDQDDINDIFIEADSYLDESHSPSPNLAATSPEEQPRSHPIADTEATNVNVKHHEEDNIDDEFLNADVQAKKPRRKRKKKHQGICPLKPTPRPAKLNKSLMMKLLLRRKIILIPNRVRNLLDPAPRPQCHLFPARKEVKPTIQPMYISQPGPAGASSLLRIHHRSSSGSNRQSRVRQATVNSRSNHGTDEAVAVPNVLDAEDHNHYDSIHAVIDSNSAQEYAVRSLLYHSPIT